MLGKSNTRLFIPCICFKYQNHTTSNLTSFPFMKILFVNQFKTFQLMSKRELSISCCLASQLLHKNLNPKNNNIRLTPPTMRDQSLCTMFPLVFHHYMIFVLSSISPSFGKITCTSKRKITFFFNNGYSHGSHLANNGTNNVQLETCPHHVRGDSP